jgi:DMSO/TMAO reductase YedYZ molybdopterin-dependent catalytic subunit
MTTPLPPNQQLVARDKWPIIGERTPRGDDRPWCLEVAGLVERAKSYSLEELKAFPVVSRVIDLHCVTRWSKLGVTFEGVRLLDVLAASGPQDAARFVDFVARSERNHSTSLAWQDCETLDPIVAWSADGEPLASEHGGPLRLVVPGRYFYKSVKWIERITLLAEDHLGYWEASAGYHNTADPWKEQRYIGGGLSKSEAARLIASRDLSGKEFVSFDAAGYELTGLNAEAALLRNAQFTNAKLNGANFRRANLSNASFDGADLQQADFRGGDLEGASLVGADLRGADLRETSLFGATFSREGESAIVDAATRWGAVALEQLTPEQGVWLAETLARAQAEQQ